MRLKRNHPKKALQKLSSILFLLLIMLPKGKTQTFSKSYQTQLEGQRDSIKALIARNEIPSMAIAVVKDGKVVWEEAFGWADKEKEIKATPETIYCLGSMSKSICATGVMTLVENEKINLEDPVNKLITPYTLRSYTNEANKIKVWHILNMSAGIPHGWTSLSNGGLADNDIGKAKLFERYGISTLPPGKVFHYANYSMGVGDIIMEQASGLPLEQYMKQTLFEPLGMDNSLVTFKEATPNHQLAKPYSSNLNPRNQYQFFPYGGGGYWSSVRDLVKYAQLHLKQSAKGGKAVLSNANIDLMHKFEKGPDAFFGLGWFNDGVKLISNGNISGFNSCLILIPAENLGVIVLTNMTSYNSIADQIAFSTVAKMATNLPEGMNREKYAAKYETPYQQNPKLEGIWEGQIKTGNHSVLVRLTCDSEVKIKIGEEPEQTLGNPVFNQLNLLEGTLRTKIPIPEFDREEAVETWLHLYLENNKLVGNATPMFSNDRGSFCYGSYWELKKK